MTDTTQVTPFLIWKHIPGYVNIQANQYGQIRDSGTHELKKFRECSGGYFTLSVKPVNARNRDVRVHSLVMLAFKGERPTGYHIDHKDGNKQNNVISNLHYVTISQNMRNISNQIIVQYNGEDTVMLDALEDMFGKDCVSAARNDPRRPLYQRIKANMHRGKTFDGAVQYEIQKRGWPTAQLAQEAA